MAGELESFLSSQVTEAMQSKEVLTHTHRYAHTGIPTYTPVMLQLTLKGPRGPLPSGSIQ